MQKALMVMIFTCMLFVFGKIKYTLSDGNVFRLTGGISVILGK